MKIITKLLSAGYRWYFPEVSLLVVSAGIYLYNAFRFSLPIGYAGLYTFMTELLVDNGFKLPLSVPFYGPGGFPYAYPPVGFYLAGFIHRLLNVPLLTYLRFAPPIYTLIFLVLDYILIKKITGSRNKALIGAFLTACVTAVYEYHASAAGMVRSPALIFAVLALILSWESLSKALPFRSTYGYSILAGLALGLTVMSHLSYALFTILSIFVIAVFKLRSGFYKQIISTILIFGSGVLFSSPWWVTMLIRHGFQTLINPARSHGNFAVIQALLTVGKQWPVILMQKLLAIPNDWTPSVMVGLMITGMIYLVLRRRWLYLVWFLLVYLVVGEARRYLVIIACIATAEMIGDLIDLVHEQEAKTNRTNVPLYAISIAVLLLFFAYSSFRIIRAVSPSLSNTLFEMSDWLKINTPTDSSYLLLDTNNDMDEWVPYLAQRTPTFGIWGAEWVGNLASLGDLSGKLTACINQQSYICLQKLMEEKNLAISWMVSLNSSTTLNAEIVANPDWQIAYQNDQFTIFKKR